ncbi:integrase catalytic domain-containing protein [Trichonephila clavipes]|nr:integrase catalytic domain-containing protein [Trichonephila clavipes]
MSLEDKKNIVKNKKACFVCLKRGHREISCKSNVRCFACRNRHFPILCPDVASNLDYNYPNNTNNTKVEETVTNTLNNHVRHSDVYLQTLIVRLHKGSSTRGEFTSYKPANLLWIADPAQRKSKIELEEETKMFFNETLNVNSEGRYEVALPWIVDNSFLPENKMLAEKSLSTKRKLVSTVHSTTVETPNYTPSRTPFLFNRSQITVVCYPRSPTLQCKYFLWTDSTTILCWIQRDQNWGTFVRNRVREICSLTSPVVWRHIPGIFNITDVVSRGCSVEQLLQQRWWEGPVWLHESEVNWPKFEDNPDEGLINSEMRKTFVITLAKTDDSDWYYKYFSSIRKIVRMLA